MAIGICAQAEDQVKVLTFNMWGVRTPVVDISKAIDDRVKLMPDQIRATGADVVVFQEAWNPAVRQRLIETMAKAGYTYSAQNNTSGTSQMAIPIGVAGTGLATIAATEYGYRRLRDRCQSGYAKLILHASRLFGDGLGATLTGVGGLATPMVRGFGNGLMVFSKYPLDANVQQLKFSSWTRPDEPVITKGAIKTRVKLPKLGWVDLYSSHLGAVTYDVKKKTYVKGEAEARMQQTRELRDFIQRTRSPDSPVILALDFNVPRLDFDPPGQMSYDYDLVTNPKTGLGLVDTYWAMHPDHSDEVSPTFDTRDNPYITSGEFSEEPRQRIDFIFASPAEHGTGLVPTASEIVFKDPIPASDQAKYGLKQLPLRLSDHYGVLTTFEIKAD